MALLSPLIRADLWQLLTHCLDDATLATAEIVFAGSIGADSSTDARVWEVIAAAERAGRVTDLIAQSRLACPNEQAALDDIERRCVSDLSKQQSVEYDAKDVFLSHHSADTPEVIKIAEHLLSLGIRPWLDQWHLQPGTVWQRPIEEALGTCRSAAIFLGPMGWGKWHEREMRIAVDRNVNSKGEFIVVPVLLPGARADVIPTSLSQLTWVKFPETLDEKNFARLVWALNGGTGEPSIEIDPSQVRRIATSSAPGNIPAQTNKLIGRDAECHELEQLFERDDVRLITLLGLGGIGKTRLAIEIAERVKPFFAHGAYFVDLTQVNEPELVAPTIADVLRVEESGTQPIVKDLCEHLKRREILLVLDNFEQVMDATDVVVTLLNIAPDLKVLVTSRVALNIEGERQYALEPLTVPATSDGHDIDQLMTVPAVAMFVERAKEAQRAFALTSQNAKAVTDICRRLEGLPLALVLAAARIKLFTPEQLISRLTNPLDDLESKQKGLPDRHRKLRAMINWSFDLLSTDEQDALAQLGVFAGGATIEAIEHVCVLEDEGNKDVLACLDQLLDSSMVYRREHTSNEPRFGMLTVLRDYAREVVAKHGQMSSLRQRHAGYFLELVEQADLIGAGQSQWLRRLDAEHDNLREAVSWKLNQTNPEAALRFGAVLARFWRLRGYRTEGRYWMSAILDKRPRKPEDYARFDTGQVRRVKCATANALVGMAMLADERGENDRAFQLYEEGLALFRELDDRQGVANVLMNLGIVALNQLDYEAAKAWFTESLTLARETGDQRIVACNLNNLGLIAHDQLELAGAENLYVESLVLTRMLGLISITAINLSNLGLISSARGDDARARFLFDESLKVCQELSNDAGIAHAVVNLGWVDLRQGDVAQAEVRFVEALRRFSALGEPRNIAECLEGLAGVAAERGQDERVAFLCGASDAMRAAHDASRPPDEEARIQKIIEQVLPRIGEKIWQVAYHNGQLANLNGSEYGNLDVT